MSIVGPGPCLLHGLPLLDIFSQKQVVNCHQRPAFILPTMSTSSVVPWQPSLASSAAVRLQPPDCSRLPSGALCASFFSQTVQFSVSLYFPNFPFADSVPLLKHPFLLPPTCSLPRKAHHLPSPPWDAFPYHLAVTGSCFLIHI